MATDYAAETMNIYSSFSSLIEKFTFVVLEVLINWIEEYFYRLTLKPI
jgi:hypothetical protein